MVVEWGGGGRVDGSFARPQNGGWTWRLSTQFWSLRYLPKRQMSSSHHWSRSPISSWWYTYIGQLIFRSRSGERTTNWSPPHTGWNWLDVGERKWREAKQRSRLSGRQKTLYRLLCKAVSAAVDRNAGCGWRQREQYNLKDERLDSDDHSEQ